MTDATIKIAMAQMLVEGGQVEANLTRAEGMIRRAGEAGCDAVVLPECLDVGWTDPDARALAEPIPGPRCQRLCQAALAAGLYVAAGLTERAGERVYNAAILASPDGRLLLTHRKVHILDIARDLYAVGDRLAVAETALGKVAMPICADNSPHTLALGNALGHMGATLLLSPSAWAVPADHDNARQPYGAEWRQSYQSLARTHGMAVVGVSNVGRIRGGPWGGRNCIGCSLAVGRDGAILRQGPYGESAEELIFVEIDGAG